MRTYTSVFAMALIACGGGDGSAASESNFESARGTLLDFELEGEVLPDLLGAEAAIAAQLKFTVGQLNGERALSRIPELSNLKILPPRAGQLPGSVRYSAKLPVAWNHKEAFPTAYTFRLPKGISTKELGTFYEKYGDKGRNCIGANEHEIAAREVDASTMWFWYRPKQCTVDAGDVVEIHAKVTVSARNTTGMYPEYHRIWRDDGRFESLVIFGKMRQGATGTNDGGILAFTSFVRSVRESLAGFGSVEWFSGPDKRPLAANATITANTPDITLTGKTFDGKAIWVTALLVDSVSDPPAEFVARYQGVTANADFIVYNGHSGFGKSLRSLADKATFKQGKYQLMMFNGCNTFSYFDGSLLEKHARETGDATGVENLDVISSTQPADFGRMGSDTHIVWSKLLYETAPATYFEILNELSPNTGMVVTGEEGNKFQPAP